MRYLDPLNHSANLFSLADNDIPVVTENIWFQAQKGVQSPDKSSNFWWGIGKIVDLYKRAYSEEEPARRVMVCDVSIIYINAGLELIKRYQSALENRDQQKIKECRDLSERIQKNRKRIENDLSRFCRLTSEEQCKIMKTFDMAFKLIDDHKEKEEGHPHPILVNLTNAVRKEDIQSGKDMEEALHLVQCLQNPEFIQKHGLSFVKLPTFEKPGDLENEIRKLREGGICAIASMYILQSLAQKPVSSELELCDRVASFREGFPAEAIGMQLLRHKIYRSKIELGEEFRHHVERLSKEKREPEEKDKLYKKITRMEVMRIMNIHDQAQASLFGLQKEGGTTKLLDLDPKKGGFNQLENREADRERFDTLAPGFYNMRFECSNQEKHVMLYLKFSFGSYLIDSNNGLLKCPSQRPSEDFISHLKYYYPLSKKRSLNIHRYLPAAAA